MFHDAMVHVQHDDNDTEMNITQIFINTINMKQQTWNMDRVLY